MIPMFTSALRIVALVAVGTALLAATYPAGSADEAARSKTKAFNPDRNGARKVPQSRLVRLDPPNRSTWCYRGRPGVRVGTVGKQFAMWIGYVQLSKNYTNKQLTRSTQNPIKIKQYRRLSRDFQKKANGKLQTACKATNGSGSGSGTGSGTRPSYDKAVRWVPFVRSRSSCESTSAPATNELRFALCGKEGITRAGGTRSSGLTTRAGSSDAKTFDNSGTFSDAASEGSASIGKIAVGPTGWTYMGLTSPVNLADTSSGGGTLCAFIRVRESTGVPSCVDSTIRNVSDIQFDNSGRVYYRGQVGSSNALRRYWDGVIVDLITSQATLGGFIALEDGTVLLTGSSAGGAWLRWLSTSLELNTILNTGPTWIKQFPDGNVYFGVACCDVTGPVRRFIAETKTLDPVPWVRDSCSGSQATNWKSNYDNSPGYFYTCTGNQFSGDRVGDCASQSNLSYCSNGLSQVSNLVVTQSGTVYGLAGWSNSRLMQMWPAVKPASTQITTVRSMREAGTLFILSGTNSAGQFVTTAYDPVTDTERTLISTSSQTEIYNLAYSSSTDEVFFDGLRFSTNSYVIGKVSVFSGAVTYLGTTTTSFSDFQAF